MRVTVHFRVIHFMLHTNGCSAGFVTAKIIFLIFQRGSVPEFEIEANQTDCLITAAQTPCRFLVVLGYPYQFIHQFAIANGAITGTVFKTKQINSSSVIVDISGRQKSVHFPYRHHILITMTNQIAQGINDTFAAVGAELD